MAMIPSKKLFVFEELPANIYINGLIVKVKREENHLKKDGTTADQVQIRYTVEGAKSERSTTWMTFSYSEKSNLYKMWVRPLVAGAFEYMEFDLQELEGMPAQFMFDEAFEEAGKMKQYLAKVIPQGSKLTPKSLPTQTVDGL
jgi:hypothetical protein